MLNVRNLFLIILLCASLIACAKDSEENQPLSNDANIEENQENNELNRENEGLEENNNSENNEEQKEQESMNDPDLQEATNEEEMKQMLDALHFTKVEVEVDYPNGQEFEIEIKQKKDGTIKAEVEDELNAFEIEDHLKAFNYLFPFVKELTITQETPRDEALDEIIRIFDLPEDYHEIEAEFTFKDGTSIEYEIER